MRYVVGDLHGYLDEFFRLRDKILAKDPDARFILTGDLIDRGPKVMETIDWAMENVNNGGIYDCILGNHEHMVLNWFLRQYIPYVKNWEGNLDMFPPTRYDLSDQLLRHNRTSWSSVKAIIDFFKRMPVSKSLSVVSPWGIRMNYGIAHGWYLDENDHKRLPEEDRVHYLVWERDDAMWGCDKENLVVVHGHTPTIEKEFFYEYNKEPINSGLIAYRKNAINVDGGIPYREMMGRFASLCAICLETLEEFYSEDIPVDYPYVENKYQKALKARIRGLE